MGGRDVTASLHPLAIRIAWSLTVVASAALAACGPRSASSSSSGSSPPESTDDAPEETGGGACREVLGPVSRELATLRPSLDTEALELGSMNLPRLPDAPLGTDVPAPVLQLRGAGQVALDGRTSDAESASEDLDTLDRNWAILHPRETPPGFVYVAAEAPRPMQDVLALRPSVVGARGIRLLVHLPPASDAPSCPSSATELCARGPAEALDDRLGVGCGGLRAAVRAVANADHTVQARLLSAAIAETDPLCRCERSDAPLLRWAFLTLAGAGLPIGAVEVPETLDDASAALSVDAFVRR
ncbi:MAG: hypothetical protein AB7S26_14385 [Sandaracinaceae bacterium]